MKNILVLMTGLAALVALAGCATPLPPGAEPGPHGTMAYEVTIEASEPGARIEANGEVMGNTPMRLKIFGDRDGTFHDFGSYHFVIRALPVSSNQFAQVRAFRTGHGLTPEDMIPKNIYFDMNQRAPDYPPPGAPMYGYPGYYGPPPYYYGPPPYYGPSFRFDIGPPRFHRRW